MDENFERGREVTRWAVAHWEEWQIICGLRPASIERNLEIYHLLKADDLQELMEMMVSRIYTMMLKELERSGADDAGAPA